MDTFREGREACGKENGEEAAADRGRGGGGEDYIKESLRERERGRESA